MEFDKMFEKFFEFTNFGVDIYDEGENVVVKVDMPGVRKEDISLKINSNSIQISAKHSEKEEVQSKKYYRKGRIIRDYSNYIELPVEIDPNSAKAKYENGVLTIIAKKSDTGREVKVE